MIDDESFSRGQKTLLVVCEDGEEEYDAEKLAKQRVARCTWWSSVEDMTPSLFVDLNKQYKPERVIIEYNSTCHLCKAGYHAAARQSWELVQVIDTGGCDDLRAPIMKNMRSADDRSAMTERRPDPVQSLRQTI